MYEMKPRGCRGAESKKRSRARWVRRRRELARAHQPLVDAANPTQFAAAARENVAVVQAQGVGSGSNPTGLRDENRGAQGQKVTDPERAQALRVTGKRTHPDSDPESPGGQDGDAELEEFDAPFSQGTKRLVTARDAHLVMSTGAAELAELQDELQYWQHRSQHWQQLYETAGVDSAAQDPTGFRGENRDDAHPVTPTGAAEVMQPERLLRVADERWRQECEAAVEKYWEQQHEVDAESPVDSLPLGAAVCQAPGGAAFAQEQEARKAAEARADVLQLLLDRESEGTSAFWVALMDLVERDLCAVAEKQGSKPPVDLDLRVENTVRDLIDAARQTDECQQHIDDSKLEREKIIESQLV